MKILMATMSLDIGGAETHILELSKELQRRGHTVTVVSKGGKYVSELEACGIRHEVLPLGSKGLRDMHNSYRGLKKLILSEQYDIVHAHARIPAFLCGRLQKKLHFRFITTVHFPFQAGFLYQRITNWGDYSLAVSCDLKQYLIDQYGVYPDKIEITVNGIDTDRFSPSISCEAQLQEFPRTQEIKRIVHVSRIDKGASDVAFQLVEAAEKLAEKRNDFEILIAGSGDMFESLQERVKDVNTVTGRKTVILAGPRTDIDKLVATGDIFVGVSRAALEAMAEGKPSIVAGAGGYIGIMEESKRDIAYKTNYCCRGCIASNADLLVKDLECLLDANPDVWQRMGEYNRRVVLESYSVEKMTDIYENAYKKLSLCEYYRKSDVLLSGYYGMGNTGDDSLLEVIVSGLRERMPGIGITVLSRDPSDTRNRMIGVRSVYSFRFFRLRREMHKGKLLLNGSGSLLQDVTSTRSVQYYIYVMRLAKKMGLKVMLYANGIGPLNKKRNIESAASILNRTDMITLRDDDSKTLLEDIGVNTEKVRITADPAFRLKACDPVWLSYRMAQEGIPENYFIVSAREWQNGESQFARVLSNACRNFSERYGCRPVIVSMQPEKDQALCQQIAEESGGCIVSGFTASEMLGLIAGARFVIGMRLHTLIYSVSAGVPVLGISYDPKVTSFMAMVNCREYLIDWKEVSEENLSEKVSSLMAEEARIRADLKVRADALREATEADLDAVVSLLKDAQKGPNIKGA